MHEQWTVTQLSPINIYNSTWSKEIQKKTYFLFVINLITQTKGNTTERGGG